MKKHFLLFVAVIIAMANTTAQTVPAGQSLIYTQDFSGLSHSSTTYTTGYQGWKIGSSSGSNFKTAAPAADEALIANSSASVTTGGVHNYNGKIGFLATSTIDPSLALSINTSGFSNVTVTFDVMTIRNPYNGSTNTRQNNVELQYRIGSDVGTFTSSSGSIYTNNTTTQTGSGVTTPQNLQTISVTLPSACNNQSVVQLRWVQRDSSGTGSRPSFAFDNICITGISTITANGSTTICSGDSVQLTAVNADSYIWNTGASTQSIYASTSGTYSVTVTKNPGCTSTGTKTVTVNSFNMPVTVFTESMGNVTTTTPVDTHEVYNGFDNDNLLMTGTADVRSTSSSSGYYTGASGGANIFFTSTASTFFQIENINTIGQENIELSFGIYKGTIASNGSDFIVEVSSNGTNYSQLSFDTLPTGDGTAIWHYRTATGTIPATNNLRIRFTNTDTSTFFRIDDVKLTGNVTQPYIVASGDTIFCQGDSVTLSAYSGVSYLWSTGATTQSITVTQSVIYTVTITDANGCTSMAIQSITTILPWLVYYNDSINPDTAENILKSLGMEIIDNSSYFRRITGCIDSLMIDSIENLTWTTTVMQFPILALHNDESRANINVDDIQTAPYNLTGSNVNMGIWEVGGIPASNNDYNSRLTLVDISTPTSHAAHVCGTMAGDGANSLANGGTASQWAGMATGASIFAWDVGGLPPATEMLDGVNNQQIVTSNNSWGVIGTSGYTPCQVYGLYFTWCGEFDQLVRDENLHIFFSVGNDQTNYINQGCGGNGYGSVRPIGTAKNVVSVGAINKADGMPGFSGWGPTQDGRLKPDIVAVGVSVESCGLTNNYTLSSGTSMACPAASGTGALLIEHFRNLNGGNTPEPALLKAIMLNSATDLGNPGPDYQFGYGKVDALRAAVIIDNNQFLTSSVANAVTNDHLLTITNPSTELKVMLAYSDLEIIANLPVGSPTLINNLDIQLIDPIGNVHLPLTLDPANPANNAVNAVNNRDNVEQIVVQNPLCGNWTIRVIGTNVPAGPQDYAVTWDIGPAPSPIPSSFAWPKHPASLARNHGTGIATDNAGDYYVTGFFSAASDFGTGTITPPTSNPTLFVAKYTENCGTNWVITGGEVQPVQVFDLGGGTKVVPDNAGNLYVSGTAASTSAPFGLTSSGGFIARLNATNGNTVWAQSINTAFTANDMAIDPSSGDIYVVGHTNSSTNADMLIYRYNNAGTQIWSDTYGSSSNDAYTGVAVDGSGEVYVSGYLFDVGGLWGMLTPTAGVFIGKYTNAGVKDWAISNGSAFDGAYDIDVDGSGNLYVTGDLNADAFVGSYTTNNGTQNWLNTFGGALEDRGIALDFNAGNVAVTGYDRNNTEQEVFINLYDNTGAPVFSTYSAVATGAWGQPNKLVLNGNGDTYITGAFFDEITFGSTTLTAPGGATNMFAARVDNAGAFFRLGQGEGRDTGERYEVKEQEIKKEIESKNPDNFQIYPNPFTNQLHIDWDNNISENINICLYNMLGEMVHKSIVNATEQNKISLYMDGLTEGIYLLRLSGNTVFAERKIILVK